VWYLQSLRSLLLPELPECFGVRDPTCVSLLRSDFTPDCALL
jgi:hypothetical protein